ncbi:hypothetical protein DLD82_07550 [Methanospirillum stamsii]|uniref:Uncharacterized protein n=2 Tax=Methanospirillum stamsii TaxID=1277351 RepID=A0A2V2N4N3_9EURY|nr:hypothetical protein DLD82_07550 [Methanospirillum stamsii]
MKRDLYLIEGLSMKIFHLVLLIMVLSISTCGSVQETTILSNNTPSSSAAATQDPDPGTVQPLATLSNDHPSTSLMLDPGVILVSFQAEGPQRMSFDPKCKHCWLEPSIREITSPFQGSHAYGIPEKDECTFNISGSGIWTAQVSRMEMNPSLQPPVNLSGSGTAVSPAFYLEKGHYIFQREEAGEASPVYDLMFSNGSYLMDANNTYVQPGFGDVYDYSSPGKIRLFDIAESGTYYLSVYAKENPKPWNASINILAPAPVMGPGPAILKST